MPILNTLANRFARWRRELAPKEFECYICKSPLSHFVPYRGGSASIPVFIRELDLVGSDVDNFNCPSCRCHDRERHLFMFFDRLKLWPNGDARILHIAPERKLSEHILNRPHLEYVRGDLFPATPDIRRVDITAIDFPDSYFDMIICNHVLEHVPDDLKAMTEFLRVLRPGGCAILQTPFSPVLAHSFQDEAINDDKSRLRYYGQEDHVRVYGLDLFERLRNCGFVVELKKHEDTLRDLDARRFGVNPLEPLVLCRKP